MIAIKDIYGVIAVGLGISAYVIYIHSTVEDKIKPHAFSWLLWTLTTAVVFAAQLTHGAEAGYWSTAFTCSVCLIIGIISLFKYDKAYTLSDVLFIGLALLALIPWYFTSDPTVSVTIIASIDVLGYGPTLRKSYYYPNEEKAISFGLNSVKHLFSLLALGSYVLSNWIYPASQIFMNGLVVVIIAIRKKKISR
jgi:hypothetical protein